MSQWDNWGCVYVIRSGSRYKIGFTAGSVWQRLTALQTGSPGVIRLFCEIPTPDPKKLERRMHETFQGRRIRGEWYALSKQDLKDLKVHEQSARKEYVFWQMQRTAERIAHSGWL